jgi:hypothetical protein
MPADTLRARLQEIADQQHGYVTTADARAIGSDRDALWQLANRGFLRHIGYGVYRFADAGSTRADEFMEAVLLVGQGSYLIDVSVLELLDLASVSRDVVHVGTRRRVRRTLPATIRVFADDRDPSDIVTYDGVPIVRPALAILDSRNLVMRDRLVAATQEANRAGLLSIAEMARVIEELQRD